MSDQAVEILITNAIHTAFIKYPVTCLEPGMTIPTRLRKILGIPRLNNCNNLLSTAAWLLKRCTSGALACDPGTKAGYRSP